ncbi:uncharacterized protein SPAPADRAFT_59665, partial [Spathaspora passalidarum NRRL Y-27907]
MEEQGTIEGHYQIRNELDQLQYHDQQRKSLIRLAVLRVHALLRHKHDIPVTKRKSGTPRKNDLEQLRAQLNEYELSINKLKQEHSTQLKLQQAKFDVLKEENSKLKSKLKSQPAQPVTRKFSGGRKPPSLFNITSNYTASPTFVNPAHITTPTRKDGRQNRSFTATHTGLSPTPLAQRSLSLNITKTNDSPSKFVDKFEKSVSPVSSPDFPHRTVNEVPKSATTSLPSSADRINKTFTDDEAYVSANSSVSSMSRESTAALEDNAPKKKKKKLQLWKSKTAKILS